MSNIFVTSHHQRLIFASYFAPPHYHQQKENHRPCHFHNHSSNHQWCESLTFCPIESFAEPICYLTNQLE